MIKIDVITNLQADLEVSGLFGKPTCGKCLFVSRRDKDAALTVFRLRAAMETDTGATGYLAEDGQQAFELGRLGDLNFVDQGGNEVVGVFEGVADVVQPIHQFTGALVDVVRGAIEFAVDGLRIFIRSTQRSIISD